MTRAGIRKFPWSTALLLLIFSWAPNPRLTAAQGGRIVVRDSAGVSIVENVFDAAPAVWRLVETPAVTIGEDRRSYQIIGLGGARKNSAGEIVLGVRGRDGRGVDVRWYSADGTYLRSAEPRGIEDFPNVIVMTGDSVGVVDVGRRTLAVYTPDGRYVRTVSERMAAAMRAGPQHRFADGSYLMYSTATVIAREGEVRLEREPRPVYRYVEGGQIDPVGMTNGTEFAIGPTGSAGPGSFGINTQPFGRTSPIAAGANEWVTGDTGLSEFRRYTPAGSLTSIVRWPAKRRAVTASELDRFNQALIGSFAGDANQVARRTAALSQRPSVAETMPEFGRLYIDGESNVWVEGYSTNYDEGPKHLDVYNKEGTRIATVSVPRRMTIHDIGSDYVLVSVAGNEGNAIIHSHDLVKN